MNTIRVSYNEILLTSQKVFEGLGHSVGTFDVAAETIAWLELHGISILAETYESLPQLGGPLNTPVIRIMETTCRNNSSIAVDLNQNHLLPSSAFVVDYLIAMVSSRSTISAQILGRYNGLYLLPSLGRFAQAGLIARVQWSIFNGEDDWRWVSASYDPISSYPALISGKSSPNNEGRDISQEPSLKIQLTRGHQGVWTSQSPKSLRTTRQFPYWFENQRQAKLAGGIEIERPLWDAWVTLAKAVLVEATAASRESGAGEQAQ